MFWITLRTDILIHLLYQINEVGIGAECTIHIEDTTTNLPVDIVTVPVIGFQRVAECLSKASQSLFVIVRTDNTIEAPELPTRLLLSFFNTSLIVCPAFFLCLLLNSSVHRIRSSALTNVRQERNFQEFCTLYFLYKLLILLLFRCDIKAVRCPTPHGNDVHTIWHRGKIATTIGTSW